MNWLVWFPGAAVSGGAGGGAGGRSAAFLGSDTGRRAGGLCVIMKAVDAIGFCRCNFGVKGL